MLQKNCFFLLDCTQQHNRNIDANMALLTLPLCTWRHKAQLQGSRRLLDTLHHYVKVNTCITFLVITAHTTATATAKSLHCGALYAHQLVAHVQQAVGARVQRGVVLALDHDALHARLTHFL